MSATLVVLAGGNGAGKSTFYDAFVKDAMGLELLSADIVARELEPCAPERAARRAQRETEVIRTRKLAALESFCYETVFSHPSKLEVLEEARRLGYRIVLVYIILASHNLHHWRVRHRVQLGGHDVPEDKIDGRLDRIPNLMRQALEQVDEFLVYDNSNSSGSEFSLLAFKRGSNEPVIVLEDPISDRLKQLLGLD